MTYVLRKDDFDDQPLPSEDDLKALGSGLDFQADVDASLGSAEDEALGQALLARQAEPERIDERAGQLADLVSERVIERLRAEIIPELLVTLRQANVGDFEVPAEAEASPSNSAFEADVLVPTLLRIAKRLAGGESYRAKRPKELAEIHLSRAMTYLADGDSQKALDELDKAFRIEPGNLNVLTLLGQVALDTGDYKKAQQMFRALLLQKLDESGPMKKSEVFLRLGEVHEKVGETPKAIQMYERAIQTDSLQAAKDRLAALKGQ